MRVENVPAQKWRTGANTKATRAAAFARSNPNEWCLVAEYDRTESARAFAVSCRKRYGKDGFEFITRTVTKGTKELGRVYCRYTPKTEGRA